MSTTYEAFCNTTTDLTAVVPDIDGFDTKRRLAGWEAIEVDKVYVCHDCGSVSRLYIDGEDMGDPEASFEAVTEEGEWFYDSTADAVYIYTNAGSPDETSIAEAGRLYSDVKAEAVARATAFAKSYVGKPILPRSGTGQQDVSLRDYDDVVIRATALLACSFLVSTTDPAKGEELQKQAYSSGNPGSLTYVPGLLDMIRDGRFTLWNEVTQQANNGIIRVVALDASTTGTIGDVAGKPATTFDILKITVRTGGTFEFGSASTVTFDSYAKDTTGLKVSKIADAVTMNGSYQYIGQGMWVRFVPGVYVAGDEWELEIRGGEPESGTGRTTKPVTRF